MVQKKVCVIGAFSVGKTSLVRRYVSGIFSDRYLSTVGVKIDRRTASVGGQDVTVLLWDLAGEDEFHSLRTSAKTGETVEPMFKDRARRMIEVNTPPVGR
jgi:GTPase SAR1 family protein